MARSVLFSLCALTVPAAGNLVDVFSKGKDGYACFRIPALVRVDNSTLILFAEGRFYSCNDHGYVDLVSKTSSDGGATWGPLFVVHSESARRGPNVTIGNAAPVVLASGRILLPFCRNNLAAAVLYSDDVGRSWGLLANITTPGNWTWVATGPPGSLELTPGGRIIVPADHTDASGHYAHAFLSDDGGRTWAISASVARGDESQAAPLTWIGPQTVLLSMRSEAPARLAALSSDGGQTWGAPWSTISETPCEGSVLALPGHTGGPVLVQSSAFSPAVRQNLTLHTSRDAGHAWVPAVSVYPGSAAYSSLVADGPGAVAIAFERDNYDHISLAAGLRIP